MKCLISSTLGKHRFKDNHGYLICTDVIMARTGKQTYTRDDCFDDGDYSEIEVDRKPEEVFSEKSLASFENVPVTIEHPSTNVDSDNYNSLSVGYVRDIHKGSYEGQPVMMGTIVLTDSEAIEKVENGELVNLSCGYDCDIVDCEIPEQKNIRGNHLALCEIPRAGITHIQDSKSIKDMALEKHRFSRDISSLYMKYSTYYYVYCPTEDIEMTDKQVEHKYNVKVKYPKKGEVEIIGKLDDLLDIIEFNNLNKYEEFEGEEFEYVEA